jgi:hypothetical protein
MLYYTILYYAMLSYAILYYAILSYSILILLLYWYLCVYLNMCRCALQGSQVQAQPWIGGGTGGDLDRGTRTNVPEWSRLLPLCTFVAISVDRERGREGEGYRVWVGKRERVRGTEQG